MTQFILVIDCGKVTPVPKGSIEYLNGTTYLNSIVKISCSENYKLNGDSSRICQETKQWSGILPKCEGTLVSLGNGYNNK